MQLTMLPALKKSLSLLVSVAGIERYLQATETRDGYRCFPRHLHHAKGSSVRAMRGLQVLSTLGSVFMAWLLEHVSTKSGKDIPQGVSRRVS